ncbi:MAG TPA: aminodeoxychorismate synthase component I [bacterium]|nr:aminodeoxychorismate synthase component I [bacterium]HPQ66809.1 aminodeoxychorismate synthase component I [bacterium]
MHGFKISDGTVVLHDPAERRWLLFQHPLQTLAARRPEDVAGVLIEAQRQVEDNRRHAAGFVAYEAAPAFDPAFAVRAAGDFPLAWFGMYEEARPVSLPAAATDGAEPIPWEASVSREEYRSAIRRIKRRIRDGDTFQVNYSYRLEAPFAGDPWALFSAMIRAQGAHYGAFMLLEDWAVCCASPESFFRLRRDELVCRPMKGTAPRGLGQTDDLRQAAWLRDSEKNRAENVMIVDMVRNDVGRIAVPGSVQVPRLFQVEKYPTLWQMTGTVACRTRAGIPEIFQALFPAASITGAPKVRTMEIVAEVERSPRKIYTGSIGFLAPGRRAQFNVAIRTVLIDRRRHRAEYGVGGGIVWDSVDDDEFEECATKAKVLTEGMPDFSLLETLLWTPENGYFLLDRHLERLGESAAYFSRSVDPEAIRRKLAALARGLAPYPHRIRLTVPPRGAPVVESRPLPPPAGAYRIRLAPAPANSRDPFLYHKTTHRRVYERAAAGCPECDDTLLWNERGEITESCIANVAVESGGRLLTPPVSCGLLPGTYRAALLRQKKIEEAVIRVEDLRAASRVYLMNSVRGLWEATLVRDGDEPPPAGRRRGSQGVAEAGGGAFSPRQ